MTTQEPDFSTEPTTNLVTDQGLSSPVHCGDPGLGLHVSRTGNDTEVGSEVTYQCWKGYELVEGNNTLTCGQDGLWVGTPPTCQLSHEFPVAAVAAISVMVVLLLSIVITDFIYHKRKKGKYRQYWQRRRLGKGQDRPTAFIVRGFKLSTVYTPTPPLYPAHLNHYSPPDLCKPGVNPVGSDEPGTDNLKESMPRRKKSSLLKKRMRRNSLDVLDGTDKHSKKTKKGRVHPVGSTEEDPGSMSDHGHYGEFPPLRGIGLLEGNRTNGDDDEDEDLASASQRSYKKKMPRDFEGTASSLEGSHTYNRFSDVESSYPKVHKRKKKSRRDDNYENIPQEEEPYYKSKKNPQHDIERGEINDSFEEDPPEVMLPPKRKPRESRYVVKDELESNHVHRPDVFVVTRYDRSPRPPPQLPRADIELFSKASPEHSLSGQRQLYNDSYEDVTGM